MIIVASSIFVFCFGFLRQSFCDALKPVLELALVDQAGLHPTEILCLPSAGIKGAPPAPGDFVYFYIKSEEHDICHQIAFVFSKKISPYSPSCLQTLLGL